MNRATRQAKDRPVQAIAVAEGLQYPQPDSIPIKGHRLAVIHAPANDPQRTSGKVLRPRAHGSSLASPSPDRTGAASNAHRSPRSQSGGTALRERPQGGQFRARSRCQTVPSGRSRTHVSLSSSSPPGNGWRRLLRPPRRPRSLARRTGLRRLSSRLAFRDEGCRVWGRSVLHRRSDAARFEDQSDRRPVRRPFAADWISSDLGRAKASFWKIPLPRSRFGFHRGSRAIAAYAVAAPRARFAVARRLIMA